MKKILFLTPQLPYPPTSGGTIKSSKLVSYLAEHYNIGLMCFLKNDDTLHEQEFVSITNLAEYWSESINKPRSTKNLLMSYLYCMPLSVYRNFSLSFKRKVAESINTYDIVFVDHYLMFQYIPSSFRGRIILHQHNAEYVMWERLAENEKSWLKRLIIVVESHRIKNFEKKICERANSILAAPNDIEKLQLLGIAKKKFYLTYHLGDTELLDLSELQFRNTKKSLLYIGTLSWEANIDGLVWFLESIWQHIKKANQDVELFIIGKNPDARIVNLVKDDLSVHLVGFVENLEDYYSVSRVFISPLRFGSGIKVKVVNALYRGIPTVTTSIGAEGLDVTHEKEIMISDNENDFANAVARLLDDESVWSSISIHSRQLMKNKYTWDTVFDNLEKAL